jgi:hypothetical protein
LEVATGGLGWFRQGLGGLDPVVWKENEEIQREREGQKEGIKKTTRERRGGDIGSKRTS